MWILRSIRLATNCHDYSEQQTNLIHSTKFEKVAFKLGELLLVEGYQLI